MGMHLLFREPDDALSVFQKFPKCTRINLRNDFIATHCQLNLSAVR
jgi:hypothetical protein